MEEIKMSFSWLDLKKQGFNLTYCITTTRFAQLSPENLTKEINAQIFLDQKMFDIDNRKQYQLSFYPRNQSPYIVKVFDDLHNVVQFIKQNIKPQPDFQKLNRTLPVSYLGPDEEYQEAMNETGYDPDLIDLSILRKNIMQVLDHPKQEKIFNDYNQIMGLNPIINYAQRIKYNEKSRQVILKPILTSEIKKLADQRKQYYLSKTIALNYSPAEYEKIAKTIEHSNSLLE